VLDGYNLTKGILDDFISIGVAKENLFKWQNVEYSDKNKLTPSKFLEFYLVFN